MPYDADVIIAGAGPAGAMAAYELARKGVDVLMLEKSVFPRYKVCGGGLTYKILKEVPYDVTPVIEREIHSVRFSRCFSDTFTRTSPDPLILCSMRERLDHLMLSRALEAGARCHHGEHVSGLHTDEEGVDVQTRMHAFRSRILIGADGAASVVAHHSGLRRDLLPGLAWEAELDSRPEDLLRYEHTLFLDWGTFPGGYGWIFPKGDHFSVGVGGPAALSRYLERYNERFIQASGIRFTGTRSMNAWPIPVRTRKGDFHAGRVLVIGDAAGLADPLTGEGIYYAVRSARLASEAVYRYLAGREPDLTTYTSRINRELMPELLEASRIKTVFTAIPVRIHQLVRDRERVWGAFCKILKGERNYTDVRTGFGRWEFLWGGACLGASMISWWKERRYHQNRK